MKKGYVYIVHAKGTKSYKIGITDRSVNERLKEMQTGCPVGLELIESLETDSYEAVEKYMHKQWAKNRTRGEWFEFEDIEPVLTTLRLSVIQSARVIDILRLKSMLDILPNGIQAREYINILDTKAQIAFISDLLLSLFDWMQEVENDVQTLKITEETRDWSESTVLAWWTNEPDEYNEASGCYG